MKRYFKLLLAALTLGAVLVTPAWAAGMETQVSCLCCAAHVTHTNNPGESIRVSLGAPLFSPVRTADQIIEVDTREFVEWLGVGARAHASATTDLEWQQWLLAASTVRRIQMQVLLEGQPFSTNIR